MDNFFVNALEFNAFKKALKATRGETVVINILSSDDSLKASSDKKQRKSMSSKFEPSPFGKFLGSRNSGPVDMNDLSSWKNKNYRNSEDIAEMEDEDDDPFFSLSNYMKDKSPNKYNDLDQAKSDLTKPITTLPSDDPILQKYSLDGYMHKLEESIMAKDKFSENDDLLEPITSSDDFMNRDVTQNINKFQDENFYNPSHNIERFAFDGNDTGASYSLNSDELDKVRERLDKLEREANNVTSKPTEKLITEPIVSDEPKDPLQEVFLPKDSLIETATESNSTRGKKLNEVVMHTDALKAGNNANNKPVLINTDDIEEMTAETPVEEEPAPEKEVLTKEDFKNMTDEFMTKLSETLGKNTETVEEPQYDEVAEYRANQDEIQSKLNELMESHEKSERETAERLRKMEEERERIDEEYKFKIKEMEESYSKKYEEFKQKMYLEKLDSERKIKENEAKIKIKNSELENKLSNKQKGAILRKELKSNFNIANLEMEKKLLEYEKEANVKVQEKIIKVQEPAKTKVKVVTKPVVQEVKVPVPVPVPTPAPAPKPEAPKRTPRSRKRRRRIDSDIIGGIQF